MALPESLKIFPMAQSNIIPHHSYGSHGTLQMNSAATPGHSLISNIEVSTLP